MRCFVSILVCFAFQPLVAQLTLNRSLSAEQIVREVLLNDESDIIVKNIRFTGKKESIAVFSDLDSLALLPEGILLTTGHVLDALGPNDDARTGRQMSGIRDNDLQAIATGVVTDAVSLEFDLIALRDSIVFEYVFASEEYPEYVSTGVNDVFGFFIREKEGRAIFPMNIARLPGTKKSVSIDNINHRVNEEYFLRSDYFANRSLDFWKENKAMAVRAYTYEFDGFTIPLRAVLKLKEGKEYHLKIAIADVGDRIVDSAVLLKAKSFGAKGKRIAAADSIVQEEVNLKMKTFSDYFQFNENLSFSLLVNFNTNESIILENSFKVLDQLALLLKEFNNLNIDIIGHTDYVGSEADNLLLSQRRAIAVKKYLFSKGVKANRMQTTGVGELEPLMKNDMEEGRAQNRRVEFRMNY